MTLCGYAYMVLDMIHMRETRTRRGLSLTALEGLTGIDASTLSRYETGKQAPSVERGFLVARALGVSLESLVDSARGDSAGADQGRGKNFSAEDNSPAPTAATR